MLFAPNCGISPVYSSEWRLSGKDRVRCGCEYFCGTCILSCAATSHILLTSFQLRCNNVGTVCMHVPTMLTTATSKQHLGTHVANGGATVLHLPVQWGRGRGRLTEKGVRAFKSTMRLPYPLVSMRHSLPMLQHHFHDPPLSFSLLPNLIRLREGRGETIGRKEGAALWLLVREGMCIYGQ